jgi:hypothetical protein
MADKTYCKMAAEFEKRFRQTLTEQEISDKKPGMIGDEACPLGRFVWDKKRDYIEYYVSWLPHYRGDSHGIIDSDGIHERLETLPLLGDRKRA